MSLPTNTFEDSLHNGNLRYHIQSKSHTASLVLPKPAYAFSPGKCCPDAWDFIRAHVNRLWVTIMVLVFCNKYCLWVDANVTLAMTQSFTEAQKAEGWWFHPTEQWQRKHILGNTLETFIFSDCISQTPFLGESKVDASIQSEQFQSLKIGTQRILKNITSLSLPWCSHLYICYSCYIIYLKAVQYQNDYSLPKQTF